MRFDRLTPSEKRYLRAMAELGPGPHRSGAIADELTREVTSLGPIRNQLISKGVVWSPSHGDTQFAGRTARCGCLAARKHGTAKSYAERLFDFREVGPLPTSRSAARHRQTSRGRGRSDQRRGLDLIIKATCGYPYFLQEWGKHAWGCGRRFTNRGRGCRAGL